MDRSSPKKAGNPNLAEDSKGTRFSSDNQPLNRGRKPKIYNVLKELGYSQDDIRIAFNEIAFYTEAQLQELYDNEEAPAITKVVAKALQNAIKSGNYSQVKDILEQLIGRAKETKEINGNLLGASVIIKSEGADPEIL